MQVPRKATQGVNVISVEIRAFSHMTLPGREKPFLPLTVCGFLLASPGAVGGCGTVATVADPPRHGAA